MHLIFSFLELGTGLRSDMCWFMPVSVRHSLIQEAQGGWSAMLRQYLRLHLLSTGGG